ncbi:hypothetical protein RB653_009962 [Dictyostelium firmibasis]|uniref:SH3 domain-containing protein n=1 Tax=Dictyostelium firmibasis TaxID=79012 RepID=A0AAN7TKT8_9MYCE
MSTQRQFSEDLWDKFESVVKKVDNGKIFTQQLSKFLSKQQQIESTYAKSLVKLCKDKSFAPDVEMGTLRDSFQCYREQLELIGALHEEFSNRLEKLVTIGIDGYLEESRKQRKALIANGEKCTKDLKTAESNESKAKQNYEKLKRKQEEANEDLSKQPPGAKEQKARKTLESASKAADKADNEYREGVKCLQQNQQKFYHEEMPRILDDLQRFEVERIDKSKDWLMEVITQNELVPPAVIIHNENIKKGIESIDRERDLQNYILVTMSGAQKPPEAQYEPYQSGGGFAIVNSSSNSNLNISRKSADHTLGGSGGMSPQQQNGASISSPQPQYQNIDHQTPPQPNIIQHQPNNNNNNNIITNVMTTPPQQQPPQPHPPQPQPTQLNNVPQPPISLNKNNDSSANSNNINSNNDNGEIVRALYDYNATEENEISFKANALIKVVLRDESGWWQGMVVGESDRIGVFPSNFISDSSDSSKKRVDVAGRKCKVLYDYRTDCEGELNIKEGEILTIEYEDEGWFFGSNEASVSARFPSNYVQVI